MISSTPSTATGTFAAVLIAACFVATPLYADDTSSSAVDDVSVHQEPLDEQVSIDDDEIVEVTDSDALFPWTGEELYYSVRVNDAEAMRGGIRAGDVRRQGQHAYLPLSASVHSRGFLDSLYPIEDRANTFLNPDTTFPFRSEKEFDENGQFRSYDVDYDHASFTANVERHREDRESTFESAIPDGTHDMLTWLYEFRQSDDLSIGDEFSYFIYDGWLLSRLDLQVAERVDVLTPIGWFKTWRVEFSREILEVEDNSDNDDAQEAEEASNDSDSDVDPVPPELSIQEEARHTGSIWLSRDENLIPVQVTIDTTFGDGRAVIIGYQPGEPG